MKTIKFLLILFGIAANAQLQQETTTYSYDNLNRLVQVVFDNGSTKNYVYDDVGNRTQLVINNSGLSVDSEVLKNPIIIYPNPTDNFLIVKFPKEFDLKSVEFQLYDVNGRMISNSNSIIQDDHIKIDVNKLSNGVYLLHLKNETNIWSQIFIKK